MKTWQVEAIVVAAVLAGTKLAAHAPPIDWVGCLAVFFTFLHAQVGFRFTESAAGVGETSGPHNVECHAWMGRYFVAKEVLWVGYFLSIGAFWAVVGAGVFLVYPMWRQLRRSRREGRRK